MDGIKCKRQGCPNELSRRLLVSGMAYCSRKCAPLGFFGMSAEEIEGLTKRLENRGQGAHARKLEERIRELAEKGWGRSQAAAALQISVSMVGYYAHRYGIRFVNRGNPNANLNRRDGAPVGRKPRYNRPGPAG